MKKAALLLALLAALALATGAPIAGMVRPSDRAGVFVCPWELWRKLLAVSRQTRPPPMSAPLSLD